MKMRLQSMMKTVPLLILLFAGCATSQKDIPHEMIGEGLAGSRWRLVYDIPGYSHREFDLILHETGMMTTTRRKPKNMDNDTWESTGDMVVLKFNNGYAVYTGKLSDNNHMAGTAINKVGTKWEWEAYRLGKR